jgi:hypothetical protein
MDDFDLLPTPGADDATGESELISAISALLGIELDPWDDEDE